MQFFPGKGKCDVLLAHDWGGGIGWELVVRHPQLVRRFVPMNCPHQGAFISVISSDYTQILKSWSVGIESFHSISIQLIFFNQSTVPNHNRCRYMIFFQLPSVPELLLTAFNSSLFEWIFQRPGLGAQEAKVYQDLYRRPSKSFIRL